MAPRTRRPKEPATPAAPAVMTELVDAGADLVLEAGALEEWALVAWLAWLAAEETRVLAGYSLLAGFSVALAEDSGSSLSAAEDLTGAAVVEAVSTGAAVVVSTLGGPERVALQKVSTAGRTLSVWGEKLVSFLYETLKLQTGWLGGKTY